MTTQKFAIATIAGGVTLFVLGGLLECRVPVRASRSAQSSA